MLQKWQKRAMMITITMVLEVTLTWMLPLFLNNDKKHDPELYLWVAGCPKLQIFLYVS